VRRKPEVRRDSRTRAATLVTVARVEQRGRTRFCGAAMSSIVVENPPGSGFVQRSWRYVVATETSTPASDSDSMMTTGAACGHG
jgi:hypothetical protein